MWGKILRMTKNNSVDQDKAKDHSKFLLYSNSSRNKNTEKRLYIRTA
jgi:hypothetical protein